MEARCEFKQRKQEGSKIEKMLDKGHLKLIQENLEYIAVVESLRYTECQSVAQRGHREDGQVGNRRNFLELLDVIAMFNKTVAKKISDSPSNAKYTYHEMQPSEQHVKLHAGLVNTLHCAH